jgi:hypothetical protein
MEFFRDDAVHICTHTFKIMGFIMLETEIIGIVFSVRFILLKVYYLKHVHSSDMLVM